MKRYGVRTHKKTVDDDGNDDEQRSVGGVPVEYRLETTLKRNILKLKFHL